MAINKVFSGMNIRVPGGSGGFPMNSLGLVVETYQRTLTYGQISGMKALLKLVKRLHPKTKLVDMAINQTNFGAPGSNDTYRVRLRYRE